MNFFVFSDGRITGNPFHTIVVGAHLDSVVSGPGLSLFRNFFLFPFFSFLCRVAVPRSDISWAVQASMTMGPARPRCWNSPSNSHNITSLTHSATESASFGPPLSSHSLSLLLSLSLSLSLFSLLLSLSLLSHTHTLTLFFYMRHFSFPQSPFVLSLNRYSAGSQRRRWDCWGAITMCRTSLRTVQVTLLSLDSPVSLDSSLSLSVSRSLGLSISFFLYFSLSLFSTWQESLITSGRC
jgi:hypothetical protein